MNITEIKNQFEKVNRQLREMAEAFPIENKDAYVSWLAQTYEYAFCTTRILALTGGYMPVEQTSIATRFMQHATEEKGHDRLLTNDAKALGVDLARVPVLPEAEGFHKSLYYWIHQGRPMVIMGWVIMLEGFAIKNGPKLYERAEKAFGSKATSFLRVHVQEDIDHVEKALAAISKFSESELEEVAHGLNLYASLYTNIYKAIADATRSGVGKKAA